MTQTATPRHTAPRDDPAPETSARRPELRAPDLCRVTIVARHAQVDLAVPATLPVALLIPSITDLVARHGRDDDPRSGRTSEVRTPEYAEPREWVLARVGQPPLSPALTLTEHQVRDGELLMLESASHVAPPPLFDDIMSAVANTGGELAPWNAATARNLGSLLTVLATFTGCAALLRPGTGSLHVINATVALFISLLLLIAGGVLSRVYRDGSTALVLCGCAVPAAFTAGTLFVPGEWSPPHALLGFVLAGAVAALSLRVTGTGLALFTGAATVSLFGALAALAGTLWSQPTRAIGGVVTAAALGALALAPRLSMMLARLPLPPMPPPGTRIDTSGADDPEIDTQYDQPLSTLDQLRLKAGRAREYLNGLVAAVTLLSIAGALLAADLDAQPYWPGLALALVTAAALMLRGRTYAGRLLAVTLIAGGAVLVLALLGAFGISAKLPMTVFLAALLFAVAALVLGVVAPRHTATPPMRRVVEYLEYACIAAVVPLVCWVTGLYALVRDL